MEVVIILPDTILSSIKIRKSDLNQFLRRTLAVALYREGRLSLDKAAELAGVRNKWEMMILLDMKGGPLDDDCVFDGEYDAADAAADLRTLRSYPGRQKE